MNLRNTIKLKAKWEEFCRNHPRFPMFIQACNQNRFTEGTIIDIKITRPDGSELSTNVKLLPEDIAMIQELKSMRQ